LITRLETRIAAEQGGLPAEIPQREEDVVGSFTPVDPTLPPASQVLEEAAARERRQTAERGVNFSILALFILLINAVFTFYISSDGKQMSPQVASWTGYSFIAVGLIPICLALQQSGGIRVLRGLRALLISMFVLSILRVTLGFSLSAITAFLFRAQGANFVPLFQRYYANTNGALQIALAAAGLLLIFAKWDTYRRGEKSSV
jgi:hypothetical protein